MNAHNSLTRRLNTLDVFCIASGAMISSGLFILPGLVYSKIGPAVILAYIFAGILFIPGLFAKAELSTAMPRAGGSYFFIERSMGSAAGTLGGFASWLSLMLKSAFALVGIGAFATLINPGITEWHIKAIAIFFCIFFTISNILSVKMTSKIQNFLVILLIAFLAVYIFRGSMLVDVHKYTPFMSGGLPSLFMATGMVFISFGGLTKIASIAEEVKNPAKSIPKGMILAFCTIMLLYGLTIFVTVGVLEPNNLSGSLTPISNGGYKILGNFGTILMAVAGIFAFVSTANAGILSASRFPVAMSRDQLMPGFFTKVNKRFDTPHFSIIFTSIFMIVSILFLNLENLVKLASALQIILFILDLLSCIIMRESKILNYKPAFVSPLYPWLQIVGIISYAFLLYKMGNLVLISTGIFTVGTIIWHKIYTRDTNLRKAALIHIVESIIDKKIAGDSLGKELREILKERDTIVEDRFDKLVKKCEILDIEEEIDYTDLFKIVSKKLAKHLKMKEKELFDSFITREQESTTEIRPGLAIPHITIPGEHKFELLIVRCESGITFSNNLSPVYAVFILLGSIDERNFHLKALSAVAQIAQAQDFDKNWLIARNKEELRDILLLSKRRRYVN